MNTSEKIIELWPQCEGNISELARRLNLSRTTIRKHLKKLNLYQQSTIPIGSFQSHDTQQLKLPPLGKTNRYLCTCIQNNTKVHPQLWKNLLKFAEYYSAEILVSTFSYDLLSYGKMSIKRGTAPSKIENSTLWYDNHVSDYIGMGDEQLELAPKLIWCGHVNILPTVQNPLAGFDTYTGSASAIFPHTKLALKSIPSSKRNRTKFNYTTGTIGLRNYIKKKAGFVAEKFHCYGFLIVEVLPDGSWFVRQICADENGSFQDLDILVENEQIILNQSIEAITWGDVHVASIDEEIKIVNWGENSIIDALRPKYQFFHDIIDFRSRNHHDRNDPHKLFRRFIQKSETVEDELQQVVDFMHFAERNFCTSVVVNSNHDNAFERWLRETDYRQDPINAIFFLKSQLAKYKSIEANQEILMSNWALRELGCPISAILLEVDENFIVCGIECGIHGHNGPNGVRGTPQNLSKLGRKVNMGHTHTAQIVDGVFVAGTSSKLDLEWLHGPSSWSHSHIIIYPNGERAIVTLWNGKWRA